MPTSPRTPRRTSSAVRDAVDETPSSTPKMRPQSTFEPSTVQDRIRQWQAQGAASALAPDALSVRSRPLSTASSDVSRAASPVEEIPKSAPARRNRWTTIDLDSPSRGRESRSSSAPRKRLVSDEHWKSKRGAAQRRSPGSKRWNDIMTPHHDMTYTSTDEREDREVRRERRRRDRLARNSGGDALQGQARDLNAYIDHELAHHFEETTMSPRNLSPEPDHSDNVSHRSYSVADDTSHTISPSKYADSLAQPEPLSLGSRRNTRGGRILGRTKEMFNKPDVTAPLNSVPIIEAWLDEQPDPFVNNVVSADVNLPAVEVPKPLKQRSRRARERNDDRVCSDPNQIWESVTSYRVREGKLDPNATSPTAVETRPRPRQRCKTPELPTEAVGEEDSPGTLRRRGAARNRRTRSSTTSPTAAAGNASKAEKQLPAIPTGEAHVGNSRSPHLTSSTNTTTAGEASANDHAPPYEAEDKLLALEPCSLKRRLTTHEDLMSVLSVPMHRKSTRSRRQVQSGPPPSAIQVLESLVDEEAKYVKELRTLVDGVVPVLLQAVLSKSSSIAAAGLFTSSLDPSDFSYTKPIIDMGIALERLKSLHGRIPIQNVDALLAWAQNAKRAYADYIKAWRLGFQDVVVNLAPLDEGQTTVDAGMARDAEGDVVNTDGEKVDVAFLLKRPLVRVKNLAKTFESISASYSKPLAAEVAQAFTDLTTSARQRHREEQARLEDEAAANFDTSKARNLRTLGASVGVTLNKTRKVRARDIFDLAMWHSTGQRLDCQVEMIFRDDPTEGLPGGDVLICEIDESGKWLLFPPLQLSSVSARRGEDDIDLVVMVRGPSGIGQEWHELLALKCDDRGAVNEWMTMLGSCPLPPRLNRTRSFLERREANVREQQQASRPGTATSVIETASVSNTSDQDVPLGEPSLVGRKSPTTPTRGKRPLLERFVPRLNLGGGLQSKPVQSWSPPAGVPKRKPVPSTIEPEGSSIFDQSSRPTSRHAKSASVPTTQTHSVQATSPKKETSASRAEECVMSGALPPTVNNVPQATAAAPQTSTGPAPVKTSAQQPRPDGSKSVPTTQQRPGYARSLSATPSEGLPSIPKLRPKPQHESSVSSVPLTESIRDQWMNLSGTAKASAPQPHTSSSQRPLRKDPTSSQKTDSQPQAPPPTPPHREGNAAFSQPSTPKKALDNAPKLTPKSQPKTNRRSSSPLKHEYAPSTASEYSVESDSDEASDASSDTSDDFMSEAKDVSMPLVAISGGRRRPSQPAQALTAPPKPPSSSAPPTTGTRTLAPSDSASQGPYRRVPSATTVPESQKSRTIALICSWSDKGVWEQVHSDECSIVVSPGLIEAFQMSAAHSGEKGSIGGDPVTHPSLDEMQPLVAFELTPIVPLRRGTALDINIRSPPTSNSKLKTTNNIMFRSRNADECDLLYGMINWARCNNPTYIQLERARPRQPPVSFNVGPARHSRTRSGGSWFSFGGNDRKSSFRASSAPISVGGETETSHSTMATAFSAIKRLGASSAFNLNRSSVSRKTGLSQTSGSLYSSNSGTGSGSGTSTPLPSQMGLVPGRDGPNVPTTSAEAANGGGMVNNMKIRLYVRKGQNWANLGSGRLSVLPAPDTSPPPTAEHTESEMTTPTNSPLRGQPGTQGPRLASSGHTPHRLHGNGREKRIVVRKNKKDEVVLLDAVLGESCFERVMQTGIAVKVWTENARVAETGGVMMGKEQIYMLQFPGTREAGWVFGLVGSYRYGAE